MSAGSAMGNWTSQEDPSKAKVPLKISTSTRVFSGTCGLTSKHRSNCFITASPAAVAFLCNGRNVCSFKNRILSHSRPLHPPTSAGGYRREPGTPTPGSPQGGSHRRQAASKWQPLYPFIASKTHCRDVAQQNSAAAVVERRGEHPRGGGLYGGQVPASCTPSKTSVGVRSAE